VTLRPEPVGAQSRSSSVRALLFPGASWDHFWGLLAWNWPMVTGPAQLGRLAGMRVRCHLPTDERSSGEPRRRGAASRVG
jgi:hypothetical protein